MSDLRGFVGVSMEQIHALTVEEFEYVLQAMVRG
jgi:hypothetical protein